MDIFRYYLALLVIVVLPPAYPFWFMVHPFIGFWRRLGVKATYWIQGLLMAAMAAGLFLLRRWLLAVDYGTDWWLVAAGAVCLVVSGVLSVKRRKHLTNRILMGLPELAPDAQPGELLTEGIYSRIRHPRYAEVIVGVLGWALVANYLATYVLAVGTVPVLYLIVILEERELRQRFGSAYEDYCRRVPRFLPRLGRAG